MAAKKTTKKADPPAAAPATDNQGTDEDPFAYTARRYSELSPDGAHSTYTDSEVPNLVLEERGAPRAD